MASGHRHEPAPRTHQIGAPIAFPSFGRSGFAVEARSVQVQRLFQAIWDELDVHSIH